MSNPAALTCDPLLGHWDDPAHCLHPPPSVLETVGLLSPGGIRSCTPCPFWGPPSLFSSFVLFSGAKVNARLVSVGRRYAWGTYCILFSRECSRHIIFDHHFLLVPHFWPPQTDWGGRGASGAALIELVFLGVGEATGKCLFGVIHSGNWEGSKMPTIPPKGFPQNKSFVRSPFHFRAFCF